jgi:hypothetical protein
MRGIKSSAKAALSINGHVFTPWLRFILGVHAGEKWAWLCVIVVSAVLAMLGRGRLAIAILFVAVLWRLGWIVAMWVRGRFFSA